MPLIKCFCKLKILFNSQQAIQYLRVSKRKMWQQSPGIWHCIYGKQFLQKQPTCNPVPADPNLDTAD